LSIDSSQGFYFYLPTTMRRDTTKTYKDR